MELIVPRHQRSKSDLAKTRIYEDNTTIFTSPYHHIAGMEQVKSCEGSSQTRLKNIEVQDSMKEEILQLQKQLKEQFIIRSELEKATIGRPLLHDPADEDSLTKPAKDLIKEISILEFEVKHLEKYLLSLYRKTFQERQSSLSATDASLKSESASKEHQSLVNPLRSLTARDSTDDPPKGFSPIFESQPLEDSYIHRSQYSSLSFRTTPTNRAVNEALESYHSLPLGMLDHAKDDFASVNLAEDLGGSISYDIQMSANSLSEKIIKCISAIYCQLADPPLFNQCYPSSPLSFPSPLSDSSPQDLFGMWSPNGEGQSSSSWVNDNPFQSDGSMELSGSSFTMVEVQGICRSTQKLSSVEHMQQNFRSLLSRLEHVDPRKLKHEERLAFWINIHNALVMHAFLVYGIPRGTLKRISLFLKAAYNIGGHIVSVRDIESTVLGCRLPRPGQWFQSLLFPKPKYKSRDAQKAYAIKHSQPLLYFALCSGSHSDPMVRTYTPKSVFQELEVAKEEYIHNNFKIQKGQKITLPKLVDLYAKELHLCPTGLMDLIEHSVPDCRRRSFKLICKGKASKKIEWDSHNFTFRYLLSPDLANWK